MALSNAERVRRYREKAKQEGVTEYEKRSFKKESKREGTRVSDVLESDKQAIAEQVRAEGMRRRAESLQSPFAKRLER